MANRWIGFALMGCFLFCVGGMAVVSLIPIVEAIVSGQAPNLKDIAISVVLVFPIFIFVFCYLLVGRAHRNSICPQCKSTLAKMTIFGGSLIDKRLMHCPVCGFEFQNQSQPRNSLSLPET
jgi:hypothetical protein